VEEVQQSGEGAAVFQVSLFSGSDDQSLNQQLVRSGLLGQDKVENNNYMALDAGTPPPSHPLAWSERNRPSGLVIWFLLPQHQLCSSGTSMASLVHARSPWDQWGYCTGQAPTWQPTDIFYFAVQSKMDQ
jgi:hypothetical protein